MLKKKRANPNYEYRGISLLAESAFQGSEEIIELLLNAGAEIFQNGSFNFNSLMSASCRKSNSEIQQMFINFGIDVNEVDSRTGKTALMYSVMSKCIENVRTILNAFPDTQIISKDGMTAYDMAVLQGDTKIAELIAGWGESGMDVDE